jgi:hypothetical protein
VDDIFYLLLFLFFVLSPLLEGLRKKQQQKQQPPTRRPPELERDGAPAGRDVDVLPPRQAAPRHAPAPTGEGRADDMVPDDLWEFLTGEKRRPGAPAPPQHAPEPAEEGVFEGWSGVPEWEEEHEDAYQDDWVEPVDERPVHEPFDRPHPIIVSLETPPPPPDSRRAAFHERLAARTGVPPQALPGRPPRQPTPRQGLRLGDVESLRQAIILREVLGPPKGLE